METSRNKLMLHWVERTVNKKRLCRVSALLIPIILSLSLITSILPEPHCEIISAVQAVFEPSDGDAWTENDASGQWKMHKKYDDDTIGWTASDVHEGSYAFNITHEGTATSIYVRVIFDANIDVSAYDGIFCWMKATSPDSSYSFKMIINPTDTNWDAANTLTTPLGGSPPAYNATWTRIFIPFMVFDVSGSVSWASIRQIYFIFFGLDSADGIEILVDNLHFTTFSVAGQTPTTDQLKMMAMTYYNMKLGQYTETISGTNYTTMYDWQNLTDNTLSSSSLEMEVLGQNIFALSLAYEETAFPFYLTEAERIVDILLLAQESNGLGAGGFHNYYSAGWNKWMGTVYNGWIMAGLSALYGQISNITYKNAVDALRDYMCGIMWNSSHNIFNANFDNDTQTVTYTSSYHAMRDGSGSLGLASYYRYVSQNATVLDRLDKVLNKILSQTTPYIQSMVYDAGKWEDNAYQMWGMWQAWMGTSNTTYRDSFLNVSKILVSTYMKHPSLNGSATRHIGQMYQWGGSGNVMDGWGLHNSLPLFYFANEIEPQTYFINALELSLFNHLRLTQDDVGGFQRMSHTIYKDKQYYGTPSFILLAFEYYHLNKSTSLYVPASTGKVTGISSCMHGCTMTITVSGTGTTTTYVYCGDKCEPAAVYVTDGNVTWNYDANTAILTLNVTHACSTKTRIYWKLPGDLDSNGIIDIFDIGLSSAHWYPGPPIGPLGYDANYDLNLDGAIDINEIDIVSADWGQTG